MKARVRDSEPAMMTAFSELGFLKIGKDITLEDVVWEESGRHAFTTFPSRSTQNPTCHNL